MGTSNWAEDPQVKIIILEQNAFMTDAIISSLFARSDIACDVEAQHEIFPETISEMVDGYDIIIVEASLLRSINFHEYEDRARVYTYVRQHINVPNGDELDNALLAESYEMGFRSFGIISSKDVLLDRIAMGDNGLSDVNFEEEKDGENESVDDFFGDDVQETVADFEGDAQDADEDEYMYEDDDDPEVIINDEEYDGYDDIYEEPEPAPVRQKPSANAGVRMTKNTEHSKNNARPQQYPYKKKGTPSSPKTADNRKPAANRKNTEPQPRKNIREGAQSSDIMQQLRENMRTGDADNNDYDELIEQKKDTRTITICSAKGGVGKTLITANLGSFLAMSQNDEGRQYEVVIVDFNIDYANLQDTLNLPREETPSMTKWTKDISNKMRRLDSSQIGYTREEIRGKFLTVEETTGVYVLCAPRTNIESMKVEKEHVEVIMRNLIENGDFDYIIVDTGNNLRDSNYIPMQKADICLMIFQQDINAIRSNMDMLDTYAQLEGFDMSKIYMLYNAVRSQKETNVSIDSITNIVLANAREHGYELGGDIKSREDNPVYGVIPFLSNAQFTVNAGGIIVTDPTNDFTKAIGAIAARLNKVELQLAVPQKKGLFGRLVSLFGRNK